METKIRILDSEVPNSFANIQLCDLNGTSFLNLRLDSVELKKLGAPQSQIALDLLLLGATVYALDRYLPRKSAPDAWTRHFSINLPVSNIEQWKPVKSVLEKCLSFLSGDVWNIEFESRTSSLVSFEREFPSLKPEIKAVSLFSGGLDSLVGAIDWLEENNDAPLMLIGHHDPRMAGPLGDQKSTLQVLNNQYQDRIYPVLPYIGSNRGNDTTLRSRSFLFISLGVYAVSQTSTTASLFIPENGMMALNPPLTPSRVGSCSTRTVHPYFLNLYQSILVDLGLPNKIFNPLEFKTKGEVLEKCLNRSVLVDAIHQTASCAKRGHTRTWLRRDAKQCGRCIPCIYRRSSLHYIGMDNEEYGMDFCDGDVDVKSDLTSSEDLRAYLSFLRRDLSNQEIAKLLLSAAKIDRSNLNKYSDLVARSADEVRSLLRDKATDEIKKEAGMLI